MCDYSLMHVKSRPASVGDKLRTTNFGTGTRGFAAPSDPGTAVCVLPGTELAFNSGIAVYGACGPTQYKTAIFAESIASARSFICRGLIRDDDETAIIAAMDWPLGAGFECSSSFSILRSREEFCRPLDK
jgi:hypothetical protein